MKYVWVGLGGAAGALTRFLLGYLLHFSVFPWEVLLANITGSFLLGLVTGLGARRGVIPEAWRAPITAGFLGGYTTFSTWAVDSVLLARSDPVMALGNVAVSIGLGLPGAYLGLVLGRCAVSVEEKTPEKTPG